MSNTLPQTGEQVKFNVKPHKLSKRTELLSWELITRLQATEGVQRITQEVQNISEAIAKHGGTTAPDVIPALAKYGQGCRVNSDHLPGGFFQVSPQKTLEELKGTMKGLLPSVTFAGTFDQNEGTSKKTVTGHTGRICLDYDHVQAHGWEPDVLANTMQMQPCVEWVNVSPSGDGVKVVVVTDYEPNEDTTQLPDANEALYEQVVTWAKSMVEGVPLDNSSKNINRLCYLPYSPSATYKRNAEPLRVDRAALEEYVQGMQKRACEGAQRTGGSVSVDDAPNAIKSAVRFTNAVKGQRGSAEAGGRHPWEVVFFLRCNSVGVPKSVLHQYASGAFTDTYQRSGRRTIDDLYKTNASEHGTKVFDPFSYSYASEEVVFAGYLGSDTGACGEILTRIWNSNFLRIVSDTGTGKTTLMREHVAPVMASSQCKFIHAVPTIALCDSVYNSYEKDYTHRAVILQGGEKIDTERIKDAEVVVCTYDSLRRLEEYVEHATIVIDECHELTTAQGYRRKTLGSVWENANRAKKVIMLTATPVPFLELLDVPTLHCINTVPKEIPTSIILYDKTPEEELLPRLMQPGEHLVLYDSKTKGAALKELLKELGERDVSHIHRDCKETNPEYHTLVNEERLPARITIGTRLLSSGLNVLDDEVTVHLVNVRSEELAVQTMARPRKKSRALLYRKEEEGGKAFPFVGDFIEERREEAVKVLRGVQAKRRIQEQERKSTRRVKGLNHQDAQTDASKYVSMTRNGPVLNHFAVYADALQKRDILSNAEEMLRRMARNYLRVAMVQDDSTTASDSREALQRYAEAIQKRTAEAERVVWDNLLVNPFAVLRAVYDSTQDEYKRERIAPFINTICKAPNAENFRNKYADVFLLETTSPAFRFCKLLSAGYSVEQVQELVRNGVRSDAAIRAQVSKLYIQVHTQIDGHKSAKDLYRLEKYKRIPEALGKEEGKYIQGQSLLKSEKDAASLVQRLERSITSGEQTVKKWSSDDSKKGKRNYKSAQKRLDANRARLTEAQARASEAKAKLGLPGEGAGLFSSEELAQIVGGAIGEKFVTPKEALRLLREWFVVKLHRKKVNGQRVARYSIDAGAESVLMGSSPALFILRADGHYELMQPLHMCMYSVQPKLYNNTPSACTPTYVHMHTPADEWEGYTAPDPAEIAPF